MIYDQLREHWKMCQMISTQSTNAHLYFKAVAGMRSTPAVVKKATSYALRRFKK